MTHVAVRGVAVGRGAQMRLDRIGGLRGRRGGVGLARGADDFNVDAADDTGPQGGQVEADIGEHHLEVRPGDAMLFSKNSPPHAMRNPEDAQQDLVYLMGGTRSPVDVCTYPRAGLRMYRIDGAKEFVPIEQVKPVS